MYNNYRCAASANYLASRISHEPPPRRRALVSEAWRGVIREYARVNPRASHDRAIALADHFAMQVASALREIEVTP